MTKKHSKRIIAKSLGAVLLAIILGASWIPAAALEGERTGSEYSALAQNAAVAATFPETQQDEKETVTQKIENISSKTVSSFEDSESSESSETAATAKETSSGTAAWEKAVESWEARTEEAASAFVTDAEADTDTPADAATPTDAVDEAADSFQTGAEADTDTPANGAAPTGAAEEAADSFQTGAEADTETPADGATPTDAAEEAADPFQTGAEADAEAPADGAAPTGAAEEAAKEAADSFGNQEEAQKEVGNPEQGAAIDGQSSESVSTLPAYAGEDDGLDGQANDTPAEAVDPSAPQAGDSGTTPAGQAGDSGTTPAGKKSYHLPVFQTSDTHGLLADTSTGTTQYRLAYISDKVRDVRGWGDAYDKSLAVLLDGGDIYQGNIISNLVKGESLSAVYDAMDYDAVTIGNHDFDWYIETTVDPDATMTDYTLDGQACVNDVPVVIANLRKNGENVDFANDYIILEKTASDQDGEQISVRIAVIGFAENYAASIMKNKFTDEGYSIQEDYDLANQLAAELEESGKCDATILLGHLAADKAAGRLGENTAVDLVLGGHTHINMCGVNDWGLSYMQPANSGSAYAYAELVFETDEQGVPLLTAVESARTVDVTKDVEKLKKDPANEQELDEQIVGLTDLFLEKIQEILNEKIGYITTSATNEALPESGGRSSTMGNWMASMFTRALDADVCFINGGAIRTSFIVDEETPEKDIYLADIYTIYPFENVLYEYEITYGELMELLDYAMTRSGFILLSRVVGIDCYFSDNTVNAVLKDGKLVYQAGEWMDGWKDKKLRVVVPEYAATTNRTDGTLSNPFCAWAETDRLLSKDHLDSDSAIDVLSAEAAENDGLLTIDTEPHFINKIYVEGDHQLENTAAVPAACEEEGSREYWTCGVCGRIFADQDGTQQIEKEDLILAATGHEWLPPTYEWNSDNTEVTARRVCKKDNSHSESETVKATSEITIEPTSTKDGERTYTSGTFLNPAFGQQTKTELIPADDTDDSSEDEDRSGEENPSGDKDPSGKEDDSSGKEKDSSAEENPSEEKDPSGEKDSSGEKDPSGEHENPDNGTITYRVAEGDGSTWTKGGTRPAAFVFKRSRDDAKTFSHFTGLLMDGKALPESGFEAAAGSLIIRLVPEYLETLSTGKHILTACFEDGNDPTAKLTILAAAKDEKKENSGGKNTSDSSKKTVSKTKNKTVSKNESGNNPNASPGTGDENRTSLWLTIMLFSVLGAALMMVLHKRQDNKTLMP